MFGPLLSDSVYFSESKTTFGMFGIIYFVVELTTVDQGLTDIFYIVFTLVFRQ
jgi:hypothetical protein